MPPRYELLKSGVVGHNRRYAFDLRAFQFLHGRCDGSITLNDIAGVLTRLHNVNCSCGGTVSASTVLVVNLRAVQDLDSLLEEFNPDDPRYICINNPQATVQDLFPDGVEGDRSVHLHLMFATDPAGPSMPFTGVRRIGARGNVCRVSGTTTKSLPTSSDYKDVVGDPGTHFIDKSDFLSKRYHPHNNPDKRIPVVFREAGFGKTVFCTMLESYFAAYERNWRTKVPSRFPVPRFGALRDQMPKNTLAFLIDFDILVQHLPEGCEHEHAEIMEACTGFMETVIAQFYEKHAVFLGEDRPKNSNKYMHTFDGLKTLLMDLGFRLFVIVDNYTSPFAHISGTSEQYLEYELWLQFIGYVAADLGGFIWRGFITGRPLNGYIPLSNRLTFAEKIEDISNEPDSLGAIGFSREEVVDLAAAVCGDTAAHLADAFGGNDIPNGGTLDVYPAKKVITVLSRLLNGDPLDRILSDDPLIPTTLSTSTFTDS
ncbi:hypothetical protein EXIGLDRAFT_720841 [Exidia glandulosa HHB12029]|uniref:AAA-ATPase-like domain-containing protein n=1 Tax=Exidia glandulosa HHB12029 TaxID=1314781 RepID=A0A165G3P4_EXIGL|nr:hypothetical protein EXIGLDRAFT_720841 [Exidia glandulosa HHB12029]